MRRLGKRTKIGKRLKNLVSFETALQFVGHIAPSVGAVVSAVAPTLAPIAGAVATGVTAVAEF